MKKLKLKSSSIRSIEKKKYAKLLEGWKVISPLKKSSSFGLLNLKKLRND